MRTLIETTVLESYKNGMDEVYSWKYIDRVTNDDGDEARMNALNMLGKLARNEDHRYYPSGSHLPSDDGVALMKEYISLLTDEELLQVLVSQDCQAFR